MKKWNLVIDISLCNNCANCQLATMDEYCQNEFPGYSAPAPKTGADWIQIQRFERGHGTQIDVSYMPTMCNHCDNAPCGAGSDDALLKRSDGIVVLVPEKAAGRKDLVAKCPFGAIHWNEERNVPQLWNFDVHLLDTGWKQPRGAHACPTQALDARCVSDEAMAEMIRDEGLDVMANVKASKPRVYYKNLKRITHCRVAGTILGTRSGQLECLEGAQVELKKQGDTLCTTSDYFGDFCFDGLDPEPRMYDLDISCQGFRPQKMAVDLIEPGVSLGEILLQAL